MIIKKVIYLHTDRETMYDISVELGLNNEALRKFLYCCYEVGVEVSINTETGDTEIVRLIGENNGI